MTYAIINPIIIDEETESEGKSKIPREVLALLSAELRPKANSMLLINVLGTSEEETTGIFIAAVHKTILLSTFMMLKCSLLFII